MNRLNFDEMRAIANRSTFHRRRAEAMGWTFRDIDVGYAGDRMFDVMLKCDFVCVCGRMERFQTVLDETTLLLSNVALEYLLDPVRQIHAHGSFSREHLIEDGFDIAFIDRVLQIEREYRE